MSDNLTESQKGYLKLGLLKNNKDWNLVESYKPISLSSCMLKVLETIIKNRLDWIIENEQMLSRHQMGFRKKKEIWANIFLCEQLCSYQSIQWRKTNKDIANVQEAYDNVNPYFLYSTLLINKIDPGLIFFY